MYDFCPMDLFSGNLSRMKSALKALFQVPHRNLRLFIDGNLVFSRSSATSFQLTVLLQRNSNCRYIPMNPFLMLPCCHRRCSLVAKEMRRISLRRYYFATSFFLLQDWFISFSCALYWQDVTILVISACESIQYSARFCLRRRSILSG